MAAVDRRTFLQRTGAGAAVGGAMWVAPSVIGLNSAWAGTSCAAPVDESAMSGWTRTAVGRGDTGTTLSKTLAAAGDKPQLTMAYNVNAITAGAANPGGSENLSIGTVTRTYDPPGTNSIPNCVLVNILEDVYTERPDKQTGRAIIDLTFSAGVTNVSFDIVNYHVQGTYVDLDSTSSRQWQAGVMINDDPANPPVGYPAAPAITSFWDSPATAFSHSSANAYINDPSVVQDKKPYWVVNEDGSGWGDIALTATATNADPITKISFYFNIHCHRDSRPQDWSNTNWPMGIANLKFCR